MHPQSQRPAGQQELRLQDHAAVQNLDVASTMVFESKPMEGYDAGKPMQFNFQLFGTMRLINSRSDIPFPIFSASAGWVISQF